MLTLDSTTIVDRRQKWVVKVDGSIVSEMENGLGFALLQQNDRYSVVLSYVNATSTHYAWVFTRGRYETRFSEVYKKEVSVVSHTERILLTIQMDKRM
jgi:hypothetical protein